MGLYTATVWIHLVAATAWIGSMIFFAAVVVPVLRRPERRAEAPAILQALGVRFRVFGWVSLGVLVATGLGNLAFHGVGWTALADADFRQTSFGRALVWKLVLVALVILVTAAHDLLVGKRAMQRLARDPTSRAALRARRTASWLGRTTLLLSLAVLYFAVALVRGMP